MPGTAVASTETPEGCGPPEPYCVAPHTVPVGHQVPPDPSSLSFDGQGCLAGEDHAHMCTGKTALSGPRFENGQCCYTMCQGLVPPCGRPLVMSGTARIAPATTGSAWCGKGSGTARGGSVARRDAPAHLRGRLADAWRRDGQFEHASVASFSRFALELLAVGAPPALVSAAQRAAADEVEHAKLCFELAASYDGVEAGAGPLPLGDLRLRTDLAEVAAAAVREGCVGETYAAHVAACGAKVCRSAEVAATLMRIADDELRHAELAWRFVSWAFARGGPAVACAVRDAFSYVPDVTDDLPPEADSAAWQHAGRFDVATLRHLRSEVLRDVVAPASARLLSCLDGLTHAEAARQTA